MDTRFWGPSGWRLLHSITFGYIPRTDKKAVRDMFEMLPYVLPCKFCRASLTEYMNKDPLESALETRESLTKWLWRIHNEVNAKLRSQNLNVVPDPPFEKVKQMYADFLSAGCSQTEFPGWDFFFSIAELHPLSKSGKTSLPIPGGPPCEDLKTSEEKNQWNCLKPEERMPLFKKFWASIGNTLPFPEWKKSWNRNATQCNLNSRKTTLQWLWKLRCRMENDLNLLNRCKYSSLCKTLRVHRSGCTKSTKARTCRKTRV